MRDKHLWKAIVSSAMRDMSMQRPTQILPHRALTDPQGGGDFALFEALISQGLCPLRARFERTLLTALIHPSGFGCGNARGLTLADLSPLDFGYTKQNARHHTTDRAAQINGGWSPMPRGR